ncbi:hypothetical protein [Microbacterium sp. NPDC087591]|uniref:hypothetical protein n=1 Tax=Microbacterium sp. NPDC087591 TaxID=3364192 RepID=UPI003805939C
MVPQHAVTARATDVGRRTVYTRADLIAAGMRGRDITASVRAGHLLRVRRDRYVLADTDRDIIEAVRIGGRLSCLSLLRSLGVFVHRCERVHVAVDQGTSRLRPVDQERAIVHWVAPSGRESPLHAAPLLDAVRQSVRCQRPRAAVATLDSLLHHGLVTRAQLEEVFRSLPVRHGALLRLVDGAAESGPETYMRLILRAIGVDYETQVLVPGVGRVDFVVEGWLIIECDSREFHSGWESQVQDRRRDCAAAQQGYVTVRPIAADIMGDENGVRQMLEAVIRTLGPKFTS